jgi:hypothetical protein
MFIRKTLKIDPKTSKEYFSYQLVESIRTERGPRQNILLTIGNDFDLSAEERKALANRINEIVSGINPLFAYPSHIESLAQSFSKQLIQKQSLPCLETNPKQSQDYHHVNVNSLENENSRDIGVEHICLETFKKLEIDSVLKQNGFSDRQVEVAAGAIISRLAGNVSELGTFEWLQEISGLDELMQASFSKLSLNTLYKIGDSLIAIKKPIEEHLKRKESDLFSFANTVALYDLTNVYYEGQALGNLKAKKGRSKEKRNDCPLITLGVVYNSEGFPLTSDIFEGNVSEPKTLETVLNRLPINLETIVILDAGLGTEDNLKWLRSNQIRYIVCSRKRNHNIPEGLSLQCVKQRKGQSVYAAAVKDEQTNEKLIYCQSESKLASEAKWMDQVQVNFEKALRNIAEGLTKKNAKKDYKSILIRIGRVKERYSRIAQFYQIDVQTDSENKFAQAVTWKCNIEKATDRFDGSYCLRVYGLDWDSQKLWDTYIMLTKAEEGFRCLKGLGLRPIFHQKETRADSHLFITLLAYHIMQSILYQLEKKGIFLSWDKLRKNLRNHNRITTTFLTKEGKKIHIRATTNPKAFHKEIYSALELESKPLGKTKTII